jgi:Tfp pilus assembly protein PilO
MQTEHLIILIVIAIAALITLGYVFILFKKVSKIEVKNQKVDEILYQ